jgi:hypothetical protein
MEESYIPPSTQTLYCNGLPANSIMVAFYNGLTKNGNANLNCRQYVVRYNEGSTDCNGQVPKQHHFTRWE